MYTMKLILFLPLFGLVLTGAMRADKIARPQETPLHAEAGPAMWSDKTHIYRGESFQLGFVKSHARYLGVVDPSGHFFYVVFPDPGAKSKLRPLVDSDAFRKMDQLQISTASLKADPYIYGVYENRPVFTKTGVYKFVMGDNLHTDDESSLTIVRVNYVDKPRPETVEVVMN